MEQGHIDRIVNYYYSAGEFKINKKYSRPHETVYTKDGDKYRWLVVERKGPDSTEVRQTDEHGKITAWDTYESSGDIVQWTCAERLRAEGRGTVRFGMDENVPPERRFASGSLSLQYKNNRQGRNKAEVCSCVGGIPQRHENDK